MSNENGNTPHQEAWHLSKSVPISLIIGGILQAGGFIWAISGMSSDIESNRDTVKDLERDISILEVRVHDTDVKIGRIEENLKTIGVVLDRIYEKIEDL